MLLSGEGPTAGAILGVPFDSTHSYRPGCRFGPDYIRGLFNNIELFDQRLGVDLETSSIQDMGNMVQTVDAASMINMVRTVVSEITSHTMPVLLGGEHLLTLGSYGALPEGTGLVVLDAHYDLRDQYAGARLSHASFLRRIIDERGAQDILHVGGRACSAEEMTMLHECHMRTMSVDAVIDGEAAPAIEEFAASYNTIYLSVDMDVADPAFCPGVGNPEACGISSHDMIRLVASLADVRIAAADIVELNPVYDNGAGGALAARVLATILAINTRTGTC